jgi:DNA-binding transcriptional ArsR family regulator
MNKSSSPARAKKNPSQMDRESLERIAELFKVFSDATRLSILQELKSGPQNVGELVEQLGTTQANVSKHLRLLHEARIVSREKQGTASYYSIDDNCVFPLCEMICDKLNRDGKSQGEVDFSI